MNAQQEQIDALRMVIGNDLPPPYEEFLRTNEGTIRGVSLLLYHASDVAERNQTFEVGKYLPGYLAIGDDSGGRLIVIRIRDEQAVPYIVDAGALMPSELVPLARDWAQWQALGFPLLQD